MPSKKRSVNLYMDDELFESVDAIARKYHRPRTWVVRLALEGQLAKRTDDGYSKEQFLKLIKCLNELTERIGVTQGELKRIGTNINQIARGVNQSHHITEEERDALEEFFGQLNVIEEYLDLDLKWTIESVGIA